MVTRPLSKFELAEFVDVSERFIEKEVKAGRLTASILGKSTLRFLPGDVESRLKAPHGCSGGGASINAPYLQTERPPTLAKGQAAEEQVTLSDVRTIFTMGVGTRQATERVPHHVRS